MLIVQLQEIGLDLTFSMQEMLLRDIVEALLDTRDQMVKFSRHRAMVSDMKCKRGNNIVSVFFGAIFCGVHNNLQLERRLQIKDRKDRKNTKVAMTTMKEQE